ncbi:UDP-Gal or UDP-GlcNAc-dependent glycosyltransferase [Trypanosoma grayi]|uniref:UDP-Gal or UDP-GlcNAc-dependent glycosyltransferase n=1 Tax=Trypanosoma grayi TaxID=71804 RepID=UPI0004F40C2C|nr:UDP-Gal or UDP-GlcNAc-dependent glycosyltransferase [Trypanosoma grayi]KEG06097.1 UDP-Gal or UDP-GlcNAc-dependent glycosyltransferase [Trypanosoma grayi]
MVITGFQCLDVISLLQPDELPHGAHTTGTVTTHRSAHALFDSESLQYVPRSVVRTWKKRDFLIVLAIPSIEMDVRRRLRILQRKSCWRFPGVATRANNFTGAMLVLYVFGRHPSHNFTYSLALQREAADWHDVIALPVNEGRPSTNKTIGGGLSWGNEAEIGLSRKVFLWFDMALRLFPTATYFAKGDDDTFLRVPQYLADLRSLPRRGVYWGVPFAEVLHKGKVTHRFQYFAGMFYTLSRDVVQQLVLFEPVRRLVRLPYSKEREKDYRLYNMQHEDVMIGRVIHEQQYAHLVLVKEQRCRFHMLDLKDPNGVPRNSSLVIHGGTDAEFLSLMYVFGNDTAAVAKRYRRKRGFLMFDC